MSNISDAIYEAVSNSDESLRKICRGAGIDASQLSRFLNGERRLTIETMEKLAEYLDLEIIVRPRSKRRK